MTLTQLSKSCGLYVETHRPTELSRMEQEALIKEFHKWDISYAYTMEDVVCEYSLRDLGPPPPRPTVEPKKIHIWEHCPETNRKYLLETYLEFPTPNEYLTSLRRYLHLRPFRDRYLLLINLTPKTSEILSGRGFTCKDNWGWKTVEANPSSKES